MQQQWHIVLGFSVTFLSFSTPALFDFSTTRGSCRPELINLIACMQVHFFIYFIFHHFFFTSAHDTDANLLVLFYIIFAIVWCWVCTLTMWVIEVLPSNIFINSADDSNQAHFIWEKGLIYEIKYCRTVRHSAHFCYVRFSGMILFYISANWVLLTIYWLLFIK